MMEDFILIDGDEVMFVGPFGAAIVAVKPGYLKGSGTCTLNGKKACVVGDEEGVAVPGCIYTTAQHPIPGVGTLKIAALAVNQRSRQTYNGGKALLLKGGNFTAKFEVQSPAKQPPPGPGAPIPDGTRQYSGTGRFVTANAVLKSR